MRLNNTLKEDFVILDSLTLQKYNSLNNAVRSRQPRMLIEKEVPGWKPPQPPAAEVARSLC